MDVDAALVDDPAGFGPVLLGRVGDGRALVPVGDRSRDRTGDDDRIIQAHTGTTPFRFHGRSTCLVAASSSARQIVARVSRGSITSSIMSLLAATYTSMVFRKVSISSRFMAAGFSAAYTCLRKLLST